MSASERGRALTEFLSLLEQKEAKLLTWGVVDGGLSEDEVHDCARNLLDGSDVDLTEQELVDALLDAQLAFRFDLGGWVAYRTRMAEAIRLFARLRQILRGRDWRTAPTLVSDFRFLLRPRVYPKRDRTLTQALHAWSEDGMLTAQRRRALEALLSGPGRTDILLSGFQLRATARVLRDLDGRWSRGMIVTVGTGSGKTLAFYAPALTHLATLVKPGEYWTKALALYPRQELLKDQFSETFVEARRLDQLLAQQGRRKLVIGAFFENTPYAANIRALEDKRSKWKRVGAGYICPYLRCPDCDGELGWARADVEQSRERLTCTDLRCGRQVHEDEVILTRERLKQTPPDVLFTTTETLNRRLSDSKFQHVFGLGAANRPHLVLLDEVHTYAGTAGAQVALLLRRWRHAAGRKVQFTGLSATLRNADEFFAALVGLNPAAVEEVRPWPAEMLTEGMEYMLALRGDPVSKTSLLSTSIQAAMLLGRILDPRGQQPSHGAFGQKVFAFTDDLDVTNRLYHNLLDAEGWDGRGRRQVRLPLAANRARAQDPSDARRFLLGQLWRICEDIGHGHGLQRGLPVGRTSSQDSGVDDRCDIIVATASLEVGFNDASVGAIIQHKAPRDAAAFLQRRGRAGRPRTMRPWTVVVLSDYGRDRLAYQGYDALFDPSLQPRSLPIANRYVMRMQATFAFLDWLSTRLPAGIPKGSMFNDCSSPVESDKPWERARRQRQVTEASLITRLLENDTALLNSLRTHLSEALEISDSEVEALLWEPPRALLTGVAPTLLRRLESQWRRVPVREGELDRDLVAPYVPLPDFVPKNLFSDLNLPEVTVLTAPPHNGGHREDVLPITQALRTLAPGAVTRRFAVQDARVSHWVAPPNLVDDDQEMPVETTCDVFEEVGTFQVTANGQIIDVRCIRPWTIRPGIPEASVLPSSNARLDWRTQIIPTGEGVQLDVPGDSPWAAFLHDVTFYIHNFRSHAEVRRFAVGSFPAIRRRSGQEFTPTIRFVEGAPPNRRPAAIGYTEFVDAAVFRCRIPGDFRVRMDDTNGAKLRGLRTAYFRQRALEDETLRAHTNVFRREWLQQIYVSALTAWAIAEDTTLECANRALRPGVVERALAKVLDTIFQTLRVDEEDEGDPDGTDPEERRQRVHAELLELCDRPEITDALARLATVLWEPVDEEFQTWARRRLTATLGGALLAACREIHPEASSDDLAIDLDPGPRPSGSPSADPDEIWVTETTLGGGGVLEEILRRFAEDPRRFFRLAESALAASDFEIVDAELRRVLELLHEDPELSARFTAVREARDHAGLQASVEEVRAALRDRGVQVTHAVMAALHARVLRPASDEHTDRLLRDVVTRWTAQEERLGIEIDARVFAYLESARTELDAVLGRLDAGAEVSREWRFRVINGLLWPRGHIARSVGLSTYHPFHPLPEMDRHLLLDLLRADTAEVPVVDPEWRELVTEALRSGRAVRLTASDAGASDLKRALLDLGTRPVELDFLQFFPQVEGVSRGPSGFAADLYMPEAVQ